jgi:hypothetical protein
LFYICGFEVEALPKCRGLKESFTPMERTLDLQDSQTIERTGYVFLPVSEKSINYFKNRTCKILLSSEATTFAKVANKWNYMIVYHI